MKQTTTKRTVIVLIMMMLTTMTAWADNPEWLKQGDSWDAATKTLTVNSNPANNAYQNRSDIEHVIVSDNVESIGNSAFGDCTNLKTVFIGNGVESIGTQAFWNCNSLKTVIVSRTSPATTIGNIPFPTNANLKIYVPADNNGYILSGYTSGNWSAYLQVNMLVGSWTSGTCAAGLKDGVLTVVGFGALEGYLGPNSRGDITSVVIEEGVTSIGAEAFKNCSNMASITIPASVTSISGNAFSGSDKLATITIDENNQTFDARDNCVAIIRKANNELVAGCKNTTIPESVTSIGAMAFQGNGNLTAITIPASVTSIGDNAFASCGLTTITIPDGVQSIDVSVFSGCSNLESVHIGSGVTSIGTNIISNCIKLATITVDANNQIFDSRDNCNAIIRKDGDELVAGCKTTVIPNGVKSIGPQSFVQSVLNSITIPNSVTSIGASAFYMSSLRTITIGSGVTSIGGRAFAACNNLERVTIYATSVPTLGTDVFLSMVNNWRKYYVFSDCVEAYKAAWGMNDAIEAIAPEASGTCGKDDPQTDEDESKNVTWQVAGEAGHYRLIISGNGDMAEYASANDVPWAAYQASIATAAICDGVTTISSSAFNQGTIITLSYTGTIPDGYVLAYTVTDANSNPVSVTEENGVYTFEMPASDVTVSVALRSTRQPVTVAFINADGTPDEASAIALDGTETSLAEGWYFVGKDISYNATLTLSGNVNLILADGCEMKVGESGEEISGNGIKRDGDADLTIYGQTAQTGTLSVYVSGDYWNAIGPRNLTINGGNVIASAEGKGAKGLKANGGGDITINRGNVNATATGTGARGIASDGNVEINGGTVNASGDVGIQSNNNLAINGGNITASSIAATIDGSVAINGGNVTASSISTLSGTITLGWTRPADRITASSISTEDGTVAVADGKMLYNGTEGLSGTITDMSKLNDKTLRTYDYRTVSYVKADGTTGSADAIPLTGGGATTLQPGWYVVNSTISYTGTVTLGNGEVNIILADGGKMNIGTDKDHRLDGSGIVNNGRDTSLTIYGQTNGTGELNIYSTGYGIYTSIGYTQHGGMVTIDALGDGISGEGYFTITDGTLNVKGYNGISSAGDMSILGGKCTVSAEELIALWPAYGNIILGWKNADDYIDVSSYSLSYGNAVVKVADGQALIDADGNIYTGTLGTGDNYTAYSVLNGKTLKPALLLTDNVDNSAQVAALDGLETTAILYGRTLYKDGDWNTLCLPFDVSTASGTLSGDGVQAMTLDTETSNLTGSTLTLNFSDAPATIPAGTPFIVKWGDKDEPLTLKGLTDLTAPVFTNVTVSNANNDVTSNDGTVSFKGTYASITYTEENKSILFVGGNNNLYWPTVGFSIGAQRAYFELNDGQQARNIVLNFGDDENATGIHSTTNFTRSSLLASLAKNLAGAWYTLDGRKLSGTPTAPGIYVKDGHKVAIKREK